MITKNRKLTVNDLPKGIPDFKNSDLPKDRLTEKWLINWIVSSLDKNLIYIGDILPNKKIIAKYLGISIGTVQNAIRYTEDKGYLQSKQKIGTLIAENIGYIINSKTNKKQNSKRDITISKIKKYMAEQGVGSIMPPAGFLAKKLNVSANTIRLAYLYLYDNGFLKKSEGKSEKRILKIINIPESETDYSLSHQSLVDKTVTDLSEYITKNLKKGSKIQTRFELAKILNVSLKTVHDAVNILEQQGILFSRRGKYGTIVIKMPEEANVLQPMNERSIFAKAEDAAFYRWEKIENEIIKIMQNELSAGMKIPAMTTLAKRFDVSTNTIRKALRKLSDKGLISFSRGRYGGTFILDIPEQKQQYAYEWLAVNQSFSNTLKVK